MYQSVFIYLLSHFIFIYLSIYLSHCTYINRSQFVFPCLIKLPLCLRLRTVMLQNRILVAERSLTRQQQWSDDLQHFTLVLTWEHGGQRSPIQSVGWSYQALPPIWVFQPYSSNCSCSIQVIIIILPSFKHRFPWFSLDICLYCPQLPPSLLGIILYPYRAIVNKF